jgi:hypothetical protein
MDKHTQDPMEPAAHMYPSDLERFSRCETSAVAFSVAVVNPDERSVPLFTAEQVISLRASRDELAKALHALEVAANTVAYCYEKRPENFAAALRDMQEAADAARAISAATGQPS